MPTGDAFVSFVSRLFVLDALPLFFVERGLLRDFWDLYAIGNSDVTLSRACAVYVKPFHVP
jgi:hypothetical protein